MALDITGVPLFAGVESLDRLLIYTLEEMIKETVDLVTINHPLYQLYKKKGWLKMKSNIGLYVPVNLEVKSNSTVKAYMSYDDADYTPQDPFKQARYAYGHISGQQVYSREELVKSQNSIEDLIELLAENLMHSMTNFFGDSIMGSQAADGRNFEGLGRIMTYNATSGGVDPTQPDFTFWNPQRMLTSAGASYSLATQLRAGLRRLARLCTYNFLEPDIYVMGEDVYDAQIAYMESAVRITIDDLRSQQGWDNFQMWTYNGKTYLYDKQLGAKDVWLINHEYLPIAIHSGTNFQYEPWQFIPGKIAAKSRSCLLYATPYCRRRDAQGAGTFT